MEITGFKTTSLQQFRFKLARVDSYVYSCSIGLFALDSFNMNNIFFPVSLEYFANLLTFEVSSDNLHFIVFADRHGSDSIFLAKILRQRSTHESPSNMRRGIKICLPVLSPGRSLVLVKFHACF